MKHELHLLAAELINNGLVEDAWQVLFRRKRLPPPEGELLNTDKEIVAYSNGVE